MIASIEPPALHYHIEKQKLLANSMEQAYQDFLKNYSLYTQTDTLDTLRAIEYKRLDQLNQIYLDYTGGSLYGLCQIHEHAQLLSQGVYGNPHSDNPTSKATTQLINQARSTILSYFNAASNEYTVIFTPNATGALKLVGESYPFQSDSIFALTYDCHNSVSGIREFARSKHATTAYIPLTLPELRIEQKTVEHTLNQAHQGKNNLFAFPAQSNFSGVQHPLEWIEYAQQRGWDVLLDAAAFVSTNTLDLSTYHPDFVVVSFYKMFGYPTGVGCLICKHSALAKLKRPWFAGGTVEIVSIAGDGYYFHEGFSAFEDGTINYLNIPAITTGLKYLEQVDIKTIHARVIMLTDWLIGQLQSLHHSNGSPLITLYGPANVYRRGGILSMNFFDPEGTCIDRDYILQCATQKNISLRTGCFCNPGSIEIINNLTAADLKKYFTGERTYTFEEYEQAIGSKLIGAVRISLGIVSNFADAYAFVQFAQSFIDKKSIVLEPRKCNSSEAHHYCSC